jgi:hypothetical protein
MLGTILNFLSGGIFKTIADTFASWKNVQYLKYQTGVAADVAIGKEMIDAQVELNRIAAAQVQADKGWWVTAWMKPAAFYVSLCHYASVVFDSLPWFGHQVGSWRIPALPGEYAGMERDIILFCVGIVGVKAVARIWSKP